jgi:cytidylate kinase
MVVITIARQLGSEGTYIARKVAEALGYHFVDKEMIEQILSQYGFVEFEEEYDTAPGFWTRFSPRRAEMVDMLNRVIQALAQHGNVVILGRGSFVVVGGFANVLNVRLQAPLPLRIKRVMEQERIAEPDRAEAILKESDKVRADFIEAFYNVRWDAADAFDIVIDTGKVAPDLAITWLVQAHHALTETTPDGAQTTGTIEVDPILATAVATTLAASW